VWSQKQDPNYLVTPKFSLKGENSENNKK